MKMSLDSFGIVTESYDELKATQTELEDNSTWETDISHLSVAPLSTPMDAELLAKDATNTIPKEILLDTVDNSGLMLEFDGRTECLRDCALPSLLTTAGISGGGISRVTKEALATGLTAFLSGSRERSKILLRAGKVAAVLSARYEPMPISEMLGICDELQQQFGRASFQSGCVSHSLTATSIRYEDATQRITDAYNKVLVASGRPPIFDGAIPRIEFRASDTAGTAARIITFLSKGSTNLPLGGFGIVHVSPCIFRADGSRVTCIDRFREEAGVLFSKLEADIASILPEMLATKIIYPGNAFVGLCKYANIPQKWGGKIEEEVRGDYPDASGCSFLDIYEALCRVTAEAVGDGLAPTSVRVLDLEEGILQGTEKQGLLDALRPSRYSRMVCFDPRK